MATNHQLTYSTLLIMLSLCMSGCELLHGDNALAKKNNNSSSTSSNITNKADNDVNFAQYYVDLKNLSDEELLAQAQRLQTQEQLGDVAAGMKLILLYSLPQSPLHNVYTAKAGLNEQVALPNKDQFSPNEQALMLLLKDQLNQQLLLIQQLIKLELRQKEGEKKIETLTLSVNQLNEKITQLKKIEQAINERGQ